MEGEWKGDERRASLGLVSGKVDLPCGIQGSLFLVTFCFVSSLQLLAHPQILGGPDLEVLPR